MTGQPSSPVVPVREGPWKQRWQMPSVCLVLAATTFAVFGQTIGFEFVNYDDGYYVYNNPMVARGLTLKGVAWAFTGVHVDNWHPLTWLSHMLDCQLYGLNPAGHHLTNVLLHTATVIVLFLVLRQMTGALWRSAFVAAVFAIHPLRVESVAWVAERKDVLSGLFFMLTLGAYVRYVRLPWSPARYGLVLVLFAMGLMSKPMLVTLPVVLLLLDYWPLQRLDPRKLSGLLMEKLPLLALSAASCIVTFLAQYGAMQLFPIPASSRFANASVAPMVYLGQMLCQTGLAVLYPYPLNGPPSWELVLAGMLLAGVSVVVWGVRRKQPWLLVGWLWYLVMLLPVMGIIQVGRQAHADRYTYLPQIGVYLAITWLVAQWRMNRAALASLVTGVVGVLMVAAWKQAAYWKDSESLWTHTLNCTTGNGVAHYNLGIALDRQGRLDEAIEHYQKALQIIPDSPTTEYCLGNDLRQKGRVDEAIEHYQKALQLRPELAAETHYNLGIALGQKGRVDEAIVQYREALQSDPDFADAHINLGITLLQTGQLDEAISHLQRTLQINPGNAKAQNNLGNAFLQKGNAAEAIAHFQQAMQLEPDDPWVKNNLAWLLATSAEASLRDGDKAVQLAREANELAGGENPIILHTLAAALAESGRFSEAVETAQRALRLAEPQSNARLAGQLQPEMKLYQAGRPFHISPKPQ
ncbi:MAG: tetratricopeptide repeat protein [Limisphaerales bacterium]